MLAAACFGIVIGIVLAPFAPFFISIAWLLTGAGLILASSVSGRAWMVVVAVAGGLVIGAWRGSAVRSDVVLYDALVGSSLQVSGVVSEDIDTDVRGRMVLRLREIRIDGRSYTGNMWATTNDIADVRRSDRVTLEGIVTEGFGSFNGALHSANIVRVERPEPGDIALRVRDYFADAVRSSMSEPESSLGLGYLVGQRRGLPAELETALQAAGLTHIVVASGYNLTILVRLSRRLFERISKYLALLGSGALIVGFIAITGLSPSMSRAGLVAGLSLLAWYYGRRFHPLVLLPLAMAITLIVQPAYAWGDLGWQLSFAAFAGVMILAPLLQAYLFGDKPERTLRRIFIETMAATVATIPTLLVSFGQFSVVAPVANMLVLPLVPLAMLLTFVAGIGTLVVPFAAGIFGFPAQLLLTYMTSTAQFLGNLPWAMQELAITPLGAGLAYAVIIASCVYMRIVTRYNLHRSSLIE